MFRVFIFSGLLLFAAASPSQAQFKLSIVEGAACAQSAAHIQALLLHFERMVAYRQELTGQYELVCARGTMDYTEYRKVCRPQSSGISFEETVFCKPLKEIEQ